MRPGSLWIDIVFCDRRNSSPVIDASAQQKLMIERAQVWWRLQVHLSTQQEPSNRNRFRHVHTFRFWRLGHTGTRFGAKILHDNLLNMTILVMNITDCQETVYPFFEGFSDADEDAGRERDGQCSCLAQHAHPNDGVLIWCGEMGHAALAQAGTDVFEHEPKADVDLFEPLHLVIAHDPRV